MMWQNGGVGKARPEPAMAEKQRVRQIKAHVLAEEYYVHFFLIVDGAALGAPAH